MILYLGLNNRPEGLTPTCCFYQRFGVTERRDCHAAFLHPFGSFAIDPARSDRMRDYHASSPAAPAAWHFADPLKGILCLEGTLLVAVIERSNVWMLYGRLDII